MSLQPILTNLTKLVGNQTKHYKFQPSKVRYHINNKIMKLCKNGDIMNALQIYKERMIKKQIVPNTYTLFALLIGCRESNNLKLPNEIWNDLVVGNNIEADFNCYQIMMNLLWKNNKNTENSDLMIELINDLHCKSEKHLNQKEWYMIIHSLSVIGDIEAMMNQYNIYNMNQNQLNPYILTSLFEGIINGGQPQYLLFIWNDIIKNNDINTLSQIIDCRVLQSLIVAICRMQRYYQFPDNFLYHIWDLIVNKLDIDISIHCYCIAILTFSKYGKYGKEYEIFKELISNEKIMDEIEINSIGFRQILTALGNLEMFDKIWTMYYKAVENNDNMHDIEALTVISQIEYRLNKLQNILNIIKVYFDINCFKLYSLIGVYRLAIKCNDIEFKNELLRILNVETNDENKNINNNIIACFGLDGKQWIIQNGIDNQCKWNSMDKVDKLIKESQYIFDNSVAKEIFNKNAREIHLKYHAEKKALSILLYETWKLDIIYISVSISMCNDCHKFFVDISKYYQRKIECVDPNGIHVFENGRCSLCIK